MSVPPEKETETNETTEAGGLAGGPGPCNCRLRHRRRNHHTTAGGATTTTAAATDNRGGETTTTGAASEEGLPLIDPLEVTGDIVTAGSSTVFPLTEAVAAQFEDDGYGGQITIDSVGTGAGFERFCEAGETDISNASRPIDEEEIALCEAIGRTPIEFRVGTDALAIVVSPKNYFVEDLTLEQLALAFSTAATWADVDPAFPAHPIARFSPGTDSGTFDYFVEAVFDEDPEPLLAASNLQLSEDDNVLVQGVEGDTCTEGDTSTSCCDRLLRIRLLLGERGGPHPRERRWSRGVG